MSESEPPLGHRGSAFRVRLELKLGTAQRESGDLGAAQETLAKAFESARWAGDLGLLIAVGRELGVTLLAASRLHQAERVLRQMLEVTAERYGADSPEWAITAEELALALRARGDAPAAVRLQREALETARGALGEQDPMTLAVGMNLDSATRAHRLFAPPSSYYFILKSGGARPEWDHYRIALSQFTRNRTTLESGLFQDSRYWLWDLPEARPFLFVAPAAEWASALQSYSHSSGEDPGGSSQEISLAQEIWEGHSEDLGESHPQTLYSKLLLSRAVAPRDVDYALELGREAAEASEAVLGRGHLDTLAALETVAALLELRGETAAAVDLRRENVLLRMADEGILGNAQPPIENLAGSLTEPAELFAESLAEPRLFEEPTEKDEGLLIVTGAGVSRAVGEPLILESEKAEGVQAGNELVSRTAHVELEPSRPIDPGECFKVGVYVDCRSPEGEGSGELVLEPVPGVTELNLRVWLVVSRHFEIDGPAVQPLLLDLQKKVSPRVVFAVRADHVREFGDEEAEVRALFSYNEWPSGEVRLRVPLSEAAAKEVS